MNDNYYYQLDATDFRDIQKNKQERQIAEGVRKNFYPKKPIPEGFEKIRKIEREQDIDFALAVHKAIMAERTCGKCERWKETESGRENKCKFHDGWWDKDEYCSDFTPKESKG